jgi:alkylation response protein AidB-like acyl-CoA dehydrogenase
MNLEFSPADTAFRDEVRAWIAANYEPAMRAKMALSKNGYLDKEGQVAWQKKLHARGWIAPDWPEEFGGPGFSATQRAIFNAEVSAAGCPIVSPMGLKMVAPVIMAFGSAEQKARHLPPILSSDVWWCQGYSEPGSGSDLASLQMRAERTARAGVDGYVLNGSKIWTTHAQWADWMFNLVRTDSSGKPQEGISFILVDMTSPGISVRSLPTLDGPVDGQQEINQVFYEDVFVPAENLIGEEGKGWTYAKYLLEFVRLIASVEQAGSQPLIEDDDFQRRLAELDIAVRALDATELKIFSGVASGGSIGAASSILKTRGSEMQQAISELALEAVGAAAQPFVADSWAVIDGRSNEPMPVPDYAAAVAPAYFNYRKTSIYAGSNEIQRNIMAKMVLGL